MNPPIVYDVAMPAIAVGFDSQGYGRFFHKEERYLVKSRGFYAVASKNWELLGPLSLHGGVSYSLENKTDHNPTAFVGFIKSLANVIQVAAEFDLASNDNQGPANIVEKERAKLATIHDKLARLRQELARISS